MAFSKKRYIVILSCLLAVFIGLSAFLANKWQKAEEAKADVIYSEIPYFFYRHLQSLSSEARHIQEALEQEQISLDKMYFYQNLTYDMGYTIAITKLYLPNWPNASMLLFSTDDMDLATWIEKASSAARRVILTCQLDRAPLADGQWETVALLPKGSPEWERMNALATCFSLLSKTYENAKQSVAERFGVSEDLLPNIHGKEVLAAFLEELAQLSKNEEFLQAYQKMQAQ